MAGQDAWRGGLKKWRQVPVSGERVRRMGRRCGSFPAGRDGGTGWTAGRESLQRLCRLVCKVVPVACTVPLPRRRPMVNVAVLSTPTRGLPGRSCRFRYRGTRIW